MSKVDSASDETTGDKGRDLLTYVFLWKYA
jgi:hypothetical protein